MNLFCLAIITAFGSLSSGATGGLSPLRSAITLHGRPVDVIDNGNLLLQFNRARYYDIRNARWLQRDPLGYVDGANLYESFGSNPARRVDPNGTDDVIDAGNDLVYQTQGFEYPFARGLAGGLVVIDHPQWPFAFVLQRADAKSLFDTGPFESDFYSPLEIMQKASSIATASATRVSIVAIFPKENYHNYPGGWARGTALDPEDEQKLQQLAQGSLQRAIGDIGHMAAVAFTATMGALAAPTGLGGVIVDVAATGADVAAGNISLSQGGLIVTALVAGTALHLRVGDEGIGGQGAAARGEARAARSSGLYSEIGGHHVHAKAAFRGHFNYDPNKGFAISQEYMALRQLSHIRMTAKQQELFRELARSGRPNTLREHSRIAVEALQAGGATVDEARVLVAQSLRNLRTQGVRVPTDIPWAQPAQP